MSLEADRTRLASLQQDFATLHETLGASGFRRAGADLVDVSIVISIALLLRDQGISPLFSVGYILVRDLPPAGRSIGKILAGITIYSADSLAPATPRQLAFRGISNLCVVFPIGLFAATFLAYLAVAAFVSGIIFFVKGGDPEVSKFFGYDPESGRTIADRIAGTHLIQPRDVRSLALMRDQIEGLRQAIDAGERGFPD